MSIVERAMEKLRQRTPDVPPLPPVGSVRAAEMTVPAVDQPSVAATPASPGVSRSTTNFNKDALRAAGLLPPETEERRLANEYRRIKRPIVGRARAAGQDPNNNAGVVVVASALPGEGKTFTAFNLALSLALEQDSSVLVIDADVAKPHLTAQLGLEHSPGLMDALFDERLDVEALINDTNVPNLSVLGSGRYADNATEMLASQRMRTLVADLRAADPRRIILFDSPPLLLTTESRELASIAGQVLLVVRAEHTLRQAVLDAIGQIGQGPFVGLVLNSFSRGGALDAYYGYGDYGTYGTGPSTAGARR